MIHLQYKLQSLSLLLSVSFLDLCILMISSLICLRFLYKFFGFLSDNGKHRSIFNTNYNLSLSLALRKKIICPFLLESGIALLEIFPHLCWICIWRFLTFSSFSTVYMFVFENKYIFGCGYASTHKIVLKVMLYVLLIN